MKYLEEFKWKISLVDGILIETGGKFGENEFNHYIDSCMEIANKYYQNTKEKQELLKVVDFYIGLYQDEILWKYHYYEMQFLNTLRANVEQL